MPSIWDFFAPQRPFWIEQWVVPDPGAHDLEAIIDHAFTSKGWERCPWPSHTADYEVSVFRGAKLLALVTSHDAIRIQIRTDLISRLAVSTSLLNTYAAAVSDAIESELCDRGIEHERQWRPHI
jgi:hypothetical protein